MRRLFLLSTLIILAILGSELSYGDDKEKYQDLFYPNGMPVKEGVLRKGQTVYEYYSEAEDPEKNCIFVLYSERIEGEPYDAHLAILKKTGKTPRIISTMDVSDYAFTSDDDREFFNHMSGKLAVVTLKGGIKLLHLSIGGEFTPGAGHSYRSNSSDVFFRIDTSNDKLSPVLELFNTSPWEYTGEMAYEKFSSTFLYRRKNKNSGTEILTQKYSYENSANDNIHTSVLDPEINVYVYDFNNNKFRLTKKISKLPSDAVAIDNVHKLDIKDPYEDIGVFSGKKKAKKMEEKPPVRK